MLLLSGERPQGGSVSEPCFPGKDASLAEPLTKKASLKVGRADGVRVQHAEI